MASHPGAVHYSSVFCSPIVTCSQVPCPPMPGPNGRTRAAAETSHVSVRGVCLWISQPDLSSLWLRETDQAGKGKCISRGSVQEQEPCADWHRINSTAVVSLMRK